MAQRQTNDRRRFSYEDRLFEPIKASVRLSAEEVAALNTTPITIVAAQNGRAICPLQAILFKPTGAWTLNTAVRFELKHKDGSGTVMMATNLAGWLDAAGAATRFIVGPGSISGPYSGFGIETTGQFEEPLVAHITTANVSGGTKGLYVICYYLSLPNFFAVPELE